MTKPVKIRKVIILPDMHVPSHDTQTLKAVEKFMAAHTWDEYVNLGDLMDFDMLSRFNAEMLRLLEGRRIQEDYELAGEILDRHAKILRSKNPDCLMTLLEGNHDERVERLLNKMPQFTGLLEVEHGLRLKERGIKWVRSWTKGELHKIGKMYFSHGNYINAYHAKKMVDSYGVNVYYGHTHDVMSIPKVHQGKDRTIEGCSLGCLCLPQPYMRGKPDRWQQAFGVAYVQPDGHFTLYVVKIFNHKFVGPDGVLYKP